MNRVYISADYDSGSGDIDVINELHAWADSNRYGLSFFDMAQVASGSVSLKPDCRPCDLKREFNRQINASSSVIFVVGDKTASRTSGSGCGRADPSSFLALCTPYKQNANGRKYCREGFTFDDPEDVNPINNFSYLRHEFEQAVKRGKRILILFNSTRNEWSWLPSYMVGYESFAMPFWTTTVYDKKTGDYYGVKEALGYD